MKTTVCSFCFTNQCVHLLFDFVCPGNGLLRELLKKMQKLLTTTKESNSQHPTLLPFATVGETGRTNHTLQLRTKIHAHQTETLPRAHTQDQVSATSFCISSFQFSCPDRSVKATRKPPGPGSRVLPAAGPSRDPRHTAPGRPLLCTPPVPGSGPVPAAPLTPASEAKDQLWLPLRISSSDHGRSHTGAGSATSPFICRRRTVSSGAAAGAAPRPARPGPAAHPELAPPLPAVS